MQEDLLKKWANFYGIEILPEGAEAHQIVDEAGTILPFTIENLATALGLPLPNSNTFDETNLSKESVISIRTIATFKKPVSKFHTTNTVEVVLEAGLSIAA